MNKDEFEQKFEDISVAASAAGKKPVTLRLWVVVAIAVVAFVVGAILL